MDSKKFTRMLPALLDPRRGEYFRTVISSFHCMSAPIPLSILNGLVSCMDVGEVYLEVGTYQGGSLISALMENYAPAIAVDNFSEFTGTNSEALLRKHLAQFGVDDRVEFHNMGYADFFKNRLPVTEKIGVYYYDGAHNYEDQYAGMAQGMEFLRPGAVLVVDDIFYPEVRNAITDLIYDNKQHIKPLLIIESPDDVDKEWWNGIAVLQMI